MVKVWELIHRIPWMNLSMCEISGIALALLFSSCSRANLEKLFYRSPRIDIQKTENYKQANGYQQDIIYLVEQLRRAYPRLSEKISDNELSRLEKEYLQRFREEDEVDPTEFEVAIQQLLAQLRDGHTSARSLSLYKEVDDIYPVSLLQKGEEVFVRNIPVDYDSILIGQKVTAINGREMDVVREKAWGFENSEHHLYALHKFRRKVHIPEYLVALGIAVADDQPLQLTLEAKDGTKTTLDLSPIAERQTYYRRGPRHPYASQQEKAYTAKILPDENVAYVQVNSFLDYLAYLDGFKQHTSFLVRPLAKAYLKRQCRRQGKMNFKSFFSSVISDANEAGVENLIIDLRYNGGGDLRLGKQIIYHLTGDASLEDQRHLYKLSTYFKKQLSGDFKSYRKKYEAKYGRSLTLDGRLVNLDSLVADDYGDFFAEIKDPASPLFVSPNRPVFEGDVYVLTSLNTFSAASITATIIKDNGLGTIVGTPPGNKPTTQTGVSTLKLPNTKLLVHLSYFYTLRPDATKHRHPFLIPHHEVWPTVENYYEGQDGQLVYVMELISQIDSLK